MRQTTRRSRPSGLGPGWVRRARRALDADRGDTGDGDTNRKSPGKSGTVSQPALENRPEHPQSTHAESER
jgi:hypothetical protein